MGPLPLLRLQTWLIDIACKIFILGLHNDAWSLRGQSLFTQSETTEPKDNTMIQDRLTAKFQSAKPAAKRETRPQPTQAPKAKAVKDPVREAYERGRKAAGSLFWL
jgi:hypothetical protein